MQDGPQRARPGRGVHQSQAEQREAQDPRAVWKGWSGQEHLLIAALPVSGTLGDFGGRAPRHRYLRAVRTEDDGPRGGGGPPEQQRLVAGVRAGQSWCHVHWFHASQSGRRCGVEGAKEKRADQAILEGRGLGGSGLPDRGLPPRNLGRAHLAGTVSEPERGRGRSHHSDHSARGVHHRREEGDQLLQEGGDKGARRGGEHELPVPAPDRVEDSRLERSG
mmetsp:Transcript_9598/g.27389  ORF Transcript_9598/g.27389 Transcript_9598/m.27389 type:complete len:220 (-) Transcript_9598:524-1183(-)